MRRSPHIMILVLLVAAVGGCGSYSKPIVAEPELTPAQQNFEAVWQASQRVLRQYYFRIDLTDRRAGVISTYPMTGKYVTEFWRKDAATRDDLAEGTLQTIRRQATVTIAGDGGSPPAYTTSVKVQVWRSDRPTPQLTSASQAYSLFMLPGSDAVDDDDRLLLKHGYASLGRYDVSLGRDENLELNIAVDIEAEAARLLGRQ